MVRMWIHTQDGSDTVSSNLSKRSMGGMMIFQEVRMETRWRVRITTVVLLALLGTKAEAGRIIRDSSGDAMQRYNSQMLDSPMLRIPAPLGLAFWPFLAYLPAPTMTIVNVQIQLPELHTSPTPPAPPPARAKFWTAQCGVFVELEVSPKMNLMGEERKPCPP